MPTRRALAKEGAYTLSQNGLVIFPTDTVYGIGASLHAPGAIHRLYTLKHRPQSQATALLLSSIDQIQWVSDQTLPAEAEETLLNLWPGALTVVLKRRFDGPYNEGLELICGGTNHVGVRVPQHALVLEMIGALGHPLVASSANPRGGSAPRNFEEINPMLIESVDVALHGDSGSGTASTVIDLTTTPFTLIRQGSITTADLQTKPTREPLTFRTKEQNEQIKIR